MKLVCNQCQFAFTLGEEARRLPHVHCPQCGHRGAPSEMTVTKAAPGGSQPWLVRLASGEVRTCRELTTLQKWIVTGEVTRSAQISRTGEAWKPLSDIPELDEFFNIATESGLGKPEGPVAGKLRGANQEEAAFVGSDISQSLHALRRIASDDGPVDGDRYESELYRGPKQKDLAKWIVISSVLLIAGSLAVIFLFVLSGDNKGNGGQSGLVNHKLNANDGGVDASVVEEDGLLAIRSGRPDALTEYVDGANTTEPDAFAMWALAESVEHASGYFAAGAPQLSRKNKGLLRKALARINKLDRAALTEPMDVARAHIMILLGERTRDIERFLDRVPATSRYAASVKLLRARLLVRAGRSAEAAKELRAAVAAATVNRDMRIPLALAQVSVGLGNSDEAKRHVSWVLSKDGEHPLAKSLQATLDKGPQVDPNDKPPVEVPADNGSSSSASVASSAVSAAPTSDSYGSLLKSANQAKSAGDCARAIILYDKALAVDAAGVAAFIGLGDCYAKTGKHTRAVGNYRAAAAIQSRNYSALSGLAKSYRALGRKQDAADIYNQIIAKFPGTARAKSAQQGLDALGLGGEAPKSSSAASSVAPKQPASAGPDSAASSASSQSSPQ